MADGRRVMTVRRRLPSHRREPVTSGRPGATAGKPASTVRKTSVNRRYSMCAHHGAASNVLTCKDSYRPSTSEDPLSRFALIKAVLGPIMRLMFRLRVEGVEHIPGD